MPTYSIRDPRSNRIVRITGDSPPTEIELHQIFASLSKTSRADESRAAVLPDDIVPSDEIPAIETEQDMSGGTFDYENIANDRIAMPVFGAAASMALPAAGLGAVARSSVPYVAPAARAVAAALGKPLISGGIGAAEGWRQGGLTGAVIGAATGGAVGPRASRGLRKFANRIDPPRGTASPAVSRPATPAPPADPVAPGSGPAPTTGSIPRPGIMSPQRIQNDLGLAVRRSKAKPFSDEDYAEATDLVKQGRSPAEAVAEVNRARSAAVPSEAPASPAKTRMAAAEVREYTKLRRRGQTHEEAMESIESQRLLVQKLGTPSAEQARQAVAQRNATGRWGDKRGQ